MKKQILYLLIILAVFPALAQEDVLRPKGRPVEDMGMADRTSYKSMWTIGFNAGLNFNFYSADLSWNPEITNSPFAVYESGFAISPYFDVFADVHVTEMIGFRFNIAYDSKKINETNTGDMEYSQDGIVADGEVDNRTNLDINGNYLGIGAMLRVNATDRLSLFAGPSVLIPVGDFNENLTEILLTEDDVFFNENLMKVRDRDFNVNEKVVFAFEFGGGYKFFISESISLVPQLFVQIPLASYEDDTDFPDDSQFFNLNGISFMGTANKQIMSVRAAVGLWFDI